MSNESPRPLDGIRVIELGQLLAGPFTGSILGYFGAEVIKVEPPGNGDPIRGWRVLDENGTSLWWHSIGRNKKSVTLDLKTERGRELVRELMKTADVVVENFRPGVMEEWGLGPEDLKPFNPGLIFARISGYGQTGPYSAKPGYASVTEGVSGFRQLNGFPGQPPVRPNLSVGDTISAIHAALGVCLALLQRQRDPSAGQVVDIALYESMFNLMESVVPEYSGAGIIREPSGTTITGIVPTNTYTCADGKYVVIGGNGDSIFKRLMTAAGHPEMAENSAMANNAGRVQHQTEIDDALAAWCASLPAATVVSTLEAERVPVGLIYNVEDQMNDPHFHARGMFEEVDVDGKPLTIPAITPVLSDTPGRTDWPGAPLGSHNEEVLKGMLKLTDEELAALAEQGIC
ncbi:MAG: CoA transferase [Halieaceae bacterium]|jgi:crotonobetainyl-CoA:carnitine CoA-transferase CaiB-like acyl-CoA transferase|nr:CoA transferase [Halieaceae bacterium]